MSIEKKELEQNPEEQKQKEQETLKWILDFNTDSKESQEFLNKTKWSDVVDAMKSDISSKTANINDEKTKKEIEEIIKWFDKYAKLWKLSDDQAKELSDIYKKIDGKLGTEGGENAAATKWFQDKETENKDKYTKLLDAVKSLDTFLKGNHEKKMKEVAAQLKVKTPEEEKPTWNPLEWMVSEKNPWVASEKKS